MAGYTVSGSTRAQVSAIFQSMRMATAKRNTSDSPMRNDSASGMPSTFCSRVTSLVTRVIRVPVG